MDNVIAFPTKPARDRADFERAIRDGLKDNSLPPDLIEKVMANMAEFINVTCIGLTFSFSLPRSIPVGLVDEIRAGFESGTSIGTSGFINRLIAERVNREVQQLIANGEI